jgi:hypothetical protein
MFNKKNHVFYVILIVMTVVEMRLFKVPFFIYLLTIIFTYNILKIEVIIIMYYVNSKT